MEIFVINKNPFSGEDHIREEMDTGENPNDLMEEDSEEEDNLLQSDFADDIILLDSDEETETTLEPQPTSELEDENSREFILDRKGETIWTNYSLKHELSNTFQKSVTIHHTGAKDAACICETELSFFELFMNDYIIDIIVFYTNEEISKKKNEANKTETYVGPTDIVEIKALIGVLIFSGAMKQGGVSYKEIYSKKFGHPFFRCVMSLKRMKFLLDHLRFDSKLTRAERRLVDKFAAFREIWQTFNINCEKYYAPSEYLTIDDTILDFNGNCPFKVTKNGVTGLKVMSLCDARTFYFCGGIPYITDNVMQWEGSLMLPTVYATRLVENVQNTNRNITGNNWFSSCEVAEELAKRKLTYVGAMRRTKKEIPPGLLSVKGLPPMTSRFLYQPDKILASFSERKSQNLLVISTMHDSGSVNFETQKPDAVEFYDMTKSGVSSMEKMCCTFTTKRSTSRWSMRCFYAMLDITGLNSYVLYYLRGGECSRANFLKTVAFDLAEAHIKRRAANLKISRRIRMEVGFMFPSIIVPPQANSSDESMHKKMRCAMCDRKKDRKTYHKCDTCGMPICKDHEDIRRLCLNCIENGGGSDEDV